MEFEIGDTVQLKSGGPLMTVDDIGKANDSGRINVACTWFEKIGPRQEHRHGTFQAATLTKAHRGDAMLVGSVRR
jgi:uncharacterized protein YodC (DUF2158 family)